jgi:twinkle protein
MSEDSKVLYKTGCGACGSSDANAIYDSGTAYCFSCGTFSVVDGEPCTNSRGSHPEFRSEAMSRGEFILGEYVRLNKRGISAETCRKYGYSVGVDHNGNDVQVANYYDETKKLIGQKVRYPDKSFKVIGKVSSLFGQQLFRNNSKKLIITEGEVDTLSIAEAYGCKYPVVSIANGAQSAYKNIKNNLEYVQSFDEVVLWFDDDEPGQKAVEQVAELFKPGQVKVVQQTGYKDANELLQAKGKSAVLSATYEAKEVRIDGIINGSELWDLVSEEESFETYDYPFPKMNEKLKGLRKGELVTFTAGSGVGKSTIVKEITYSLAIQQKQKVGYIALEENVKRSALGFMGIYLNKPLFFDYASITQEQKKEAFDNTLGTGRIYLYDHFGSMDEENLIRKMRLLILQSNVDFIILDHISIVVSGMDANGDERKAIDVLMTKLRSLAEETQAGIIIISHLRRLQGDKGHEDGAQISLSQLRGSGAIAQLSDSVIGVERNLQAAEGNNRIELRVLKNRFAGDVGLADTLLYDKKTGRIVESDDVFLSEEF